MKFKEGDILEVVNEQGLSAEKGATATCRGYTTYGDDEFVQVVWNIDEFWNGQEDGGYYEYHFVKIGEVKDLK